MSKLDTTDRDRQERKERRAEAADNLYRDTYYGLNLESAFTGWKRLAILLMVLYPPGCLYVMAMNDDRATRDQAAARVTGEAIAPLPPFWDAYGWPTLLFLVFAFGLLLYACLRQIEVYLAIIAAHARGVTIRAGANTPPNKPL